MPKPRPASSGRRPPTPDPKALFSESSEPAHTDRAPVAAPSDESGEHEPIARDSGPRDYTLMVPTILPFEAKLVVEKGMHAGKVLKLGGGTASVGRSSKCDLSLKGAPGVSRRHCKVQLVGTQYVVLDLESRNGTLVNGKQVDRHILQDGDVIEVCDEMIRYAVSAKKGAAPPMSVSRSPAPVALADVDINDASTRLIDPVPDSAAEHATKQERSKKTRPPPIPRRPEPTPPPRLVDDPIPPPVPERESAAEAATASMFLELPPDLPADGARRVRDELEDVDDEPQILGEVSVSGQEPSSPYVHQPPQRGGIGVMHVLLVIALLVVATLGVAAYDIALGEQVLLRMVRGEPQPAAEARPSTAAVQLEEKAVEAAPPPAVPEKNEEQLVPTTKEDAPAQAPDVREAKADEPDEPQEQPPVAEEKTAPPPAPPPARDITEQVTLRAGIGGRVSRVAVKPGDAIKRGATIAWLEGSGGGRKLESLREEEAAFEAAARRGNKAAERDLAKVRADIAEITRAMRERPLTADGEGRVVNVLVKVGTRVKPGDALAIFQPN
jgi:pSer/pThr/pTyr-binding forkhead associated (FHA) protein/biotin carboxyl carrier protein